MGRKAFAAFRKIFSLSLIAVFVCGCHKSSGAGDQKVHLVEISDFGSNPGQLRMFEYVPRSARRNSPLVIAIHGCAQNAQSYADHSGWPEVANRLGFLLVFPQQSITNNPTRCFNWFEPDNSRRDSGEALSIKQMVDKVKASSAVDPKRVFVTGLSAGGAMTSIMLATYPDVFAGGAIMSGTPFGCANSLSQSVACLRSEINKTPKEWGDLVRHATSTEYWPVVSIWQGMDDKIVNPANAHEEEEQWTNVHGVFQNSMTSEKMAGYAHRQYVKGGKILVEMYLIDKMGHGQAVNPGTSAEQCGTAGMFFPDVHVCAAYFVTRFWHLGH